MTKDVINPDAALKDKLHGQGVDGLVDDAVAAEVRQGHRPFAAAPRSLTDRAQPTESPLDYCKGDDRGYRGL